MTCDAFDSLFTVKSPPVNSRQPDGLTSIGGGAFISCTSLALTRLPDGLTHIGDRAFKECTGISRSTLKKSDGHGICRRRHVCHCRPLGAGGCYAQASLNFSLAAAGRHGTEGAAQVLLRVPRLEAGHAVSAVCSLAPSLSRRADDARNLQGGDACVAQAIRTMRGEVVDTPKNK